MDITPQQALELINGYRKKPEAYVADVYGSVLWEKQVEILLSVFTNPTTAVKTSNAVGKSYVAARIAHAFLDLIPASIVVTTAPTWRQVKDVLWREFHTTHNKARFPLGGKLTQLGFEYDKDWYAVGLSSRYPENFFGYHADHILVIVDEAGGVPEPIFRGVKAITPNANARVLYIGNPTNPSGTFYNAFNDPMVKKFTISAFDTPNFRHVGITNLPELVKVMTPPEGVDAVDHRPFKNVEWPYAGLISPQVVYSRFLEWGTDNPLWQSLIMGEFPSQAENSLIPMNLILQSMQDMDKVDPDTGKTYASLSGWNVEDGPLNYGLDMARFGTDRTVLTPRHGGFVDELITWTKADLVESAQRVFKIIDPFKPTNINIDDTGNGGGTTDALNHFKNDPTVKYMYTVTPYNFSSAPFDKERFHDITSEIYWNLREQFYNRCISLPNDEELKGELAARQWKITPSGKIKVESKDEYRKRTGANSPDKSDSLALAFAAPTSGSWGNMQNAGGNSAAQQTYTGGLLNTRY